MEHFRVARQRGTSTEVRRRRMTVCYFPNDAEIKGIEVLFFFYDSLSIQWSFRICEREYGIREDVKS